MTDFLFHNFWCHMIWFIYMISILLTATNQISVKIKHADQKFLGGGGGGGDGGGGGGGCAVKGFVCLINIHNYIHFKTPVKQEGSTK